MTSLLAALIISIIPQDSGVLVDSVDVMERNFFYDEQGRLVFEQLLMWEWSHKEGRHNIRAWRLIKDPSQIPARDWVNGGYVVTWTDGEVVRRVRSPAFREDHLQYDIELEERRHLEKELRRELRPLKKR